MLVGIAQAIEIPERGATFFDTLERFNRYYTDPEYSPSKILYVSPSGGGIGSQISPMSVTAAFDQVSAGQEIRFMPGQYAGCWGLDKDSSGTYDAPIVIKADHEVTVDCCNSGRYSCFNLEFADYVAIDGFTLQGGNYGVRTVGGYATDEHQKGVAILNNHGLDQYRDPFFSGGSDWIVVENNIAHGAGTGDGHGIYLSNGSDWMIVRNNELYDNSSSDFQINADPISTCEDLGIPYDDPLCDGSATDGLGQGVSEFVLMENNYFHNGRAQGPNFTSVRNSVFRNNIIGFYIRHGTSFWQETSNPKLGSSNNIVEHNLFIGENSWHVLQFINDSKNNGIRNNVFLGISLPAATANDNVLLLEQDVTTHGTNTIAGNYFAGGYFENFTPTGTNQWVHDFDPDWFFDFPLDRMGDIASFKPTEMAPFIASGDLLDSSPLDISGTRRFEPTDLGPWQITKSNACIVEEKDPVDTVKPPYKCDAIVVSEGFHIVQGGDVTLQAVHYMQFGSDFLVGSGGVLHAQMGLGSN